MPVIRMLQPSILLNGRRIRQMDPVANIHESVHHPVPVIGRFHRNLYRKKGVRSQHLTPTTLSVPCPKKKENRMARMEP
ncbi:MAG: hypothetical protein ACUVT6_13470 [Thermodesulfobacteriota bacterium]